MRRLDHTPDGEVDVVAGIVDGLAMTGKLTMMLCSSGAIRGMSGVWGAEAPEVDDFLVDADTSAVYTASLAHTLGKVRALSVGSRWPVVHVLDVSGFAEVVPAVVGSCTIAVFHLDGWFGSGHPLPDDAADEVFHALERDAGSSSFVVSIPSGLPDAITSTFVSSAAPLEFAGFLVVAEPVAQRGLIREREA